jgi:isoquinoline 1-oxidoreductase beta subunit
VAERVGWSKPAPQGVHRGLAHMKAFNAYVAAAAEVSVEGGNRIRIHRIVAATDPIYAVNPAQIERQVAGSFVYGLSAVFYGECTVEKGRIVEGNFDTYDSMRIAQMPPVETIIMPSGGSDPWGGIGEPTICVAAPAVLNAYAKATGQRIRTIPLKNQRVRMA